MKRLVLAFLVTAACAASAAEPDLILHHGKVFMSPGQYVEAVAIGNGRILDVGANKAILKSKTAKTRLIDLRGKTVTPGFHDAHVHFMKGALFLGQLDLNGCVSIAEVQRRLKKYAKENPDLPWIIGRGWDQTAFPSKKYPSRSDIDAVISTRPVALVHTDGHILWANTVALRQASITRKTRNPPNGEIVRDAAGEPTGVLIESAIEMVKAVLPKPDHGAMLAALRKALSLAESYGVTSIQGPLDVSPREELEAWKELYKTKQAHLRYFAWGRLEEPVDFAQLQASYPDLPGDKFRFGGLKGFVDGVISARTAALLEPYSDDIGTRGEPRYSEQRLKELVQTAHGAGYQVELHAIGDRAVRMSLDACGAALKASSVSWRSSAAYCKIEHVELVDPGDLPRFRQLGVVASMQPSHMTYDREDQNYNPERLGSRIRYAFAWKSLVEAGATLVFGTDWPVMPLDPRVDLFAAITRQHFDGKPPGGWIPEQKLSLEDAIVHYTLEPARAIGRADELGSIEPGKLADLVVFDRDLFAVSGLDLLKIPIDMTIFEGKVVYERRP